MSVLRDGDLPLVFERGRPGRQAFALPELDVPETATDEWEAFARTDSPRLPELSEVDVIRHFTALSTRNHGVDSGFYPLGSCTMKYNPKRN
ncbi:MAG: aminomethyl-transferring glycine dehydrogenase subunit GcvPB, partial [Alicyclobacillus sp.]|nr:aminomethyl-transferring glycine dehydrogenase subunit GcvPB [Alicyclobacillus sp.]